MTEQFNPENDTSDLAAQDSYWFVDEQNVIRAVCTKCKPPEGTGWFWRGSVDGYGNYDLDCHACGNPIHKMRDSE